MRQHSELFAVASRGLRFTDITQQVNEFVSSAQIRSGVLTLFVQHTSASLLVQENADPDVLKDLEDAFARLAPRAAKYRHTTEGPDDMPAHIRSALTQTSISIPVIEGAPALGEWQAIYLFEHRDAPHQRSIAMHVIGE